MEQNEKPSEAPAPIAETGKSREEIMRAFLEPFDPAQIKFKPQIISGNRAMALAYIDARLVQDRLDEVVGIDGWSDNYEALPDGSVICRLKIKIGKKWILKTDIGGQSEQPDGGDRMKAAVSDALKRAAVKFGIGRYLYRLPNQWVDWDAQKRQFVNTPKLPAFAIPSAQQRKAPVQGQKPQPPAPKPAPAKPTTAVHTLPANGEELQKRLTSYEEKLVSRGLCVKGELLAAILEHGTKAGYGADMLTWPAPAITLAVEQTKSFEQTKSTSNRKTHGAVGS